MQPTTIASIVAIVAVMLGVVVWWWRSRSASSTKPSKNAPRSPPPSGESTLIAKSLAGVVDVPPEGYTIEAREGAVLSTWSASGTNRGKQELHRSFPALSSTFTNLFRIRTLGGNYGGGLHHIYAVGTHYDNGVGSYRWSFASMGRNNTITVYQQNPTGEGLTDESLLSITETYNRSSSVALPVDLRVKYEDGSALIQARIPASFTTFTGMWSFYCETYVGGNTLLRVENA